MHFSRSLSSLARGNMVWGQLQPHKITNTALIKAFLSVNRETFAPPFYQDHCYNDQVIPLSAGRSLFPPLVLAQLLQHLLSKPISKCLIVGSGTGYSTAILSSCHVPCFALESDLVLYNQATEFLNSFPLTQVLHGPLQAGLAAQAPFDAILIDGGSAPSIPFSLLQQLTPYQGRAYAVIAPSSPLLPTLGHGVCYTVGENANQLEKKVLFEAKLPMNGDFWQGENFTF